MRPNSKSATATIDDWSDAHDENHRRVELLEGELVVVSPPKISHQRAVSRLFCAIAKFVEDRRLGGEVFTGPTGVRLATHTMLEPDVVYVAAADAHRILDGWIDGPATLAVEVLSSSNRAYDAVKKRALYEKYGVPELWIVDPDAKTATICALENVHYCETVFGEPQTASSAHALPGFTIDVAALFKT